MKNALNRRSLLHNLGLGCGTLAVAALLPRCSNAVGSGISATMDPSSLEHENAAQNATRKWYELGLMPDEILNDTLLFYLGHVWQGMADIGECLDTASRVDGKDEWSWTREWFRTAERLRNVAKSSASNGHRLSAGESYLRAANYYMAALHRHPDPTDPGVRTSAALSVACIDKAIELDALSASRVQIPYERTTLPGLFFRSAIADARAPVLIVHQGRDGWAAHCKFVADSAVRRGYHCLLFDGPGAGQVIRLQGLTVRHDWENVIGPVIDFVLRQPGVDATRIGLMGISMGGALAPRAAAFEPRLKACIADPGVYSWYRVVSNFFGAELCELAETVPNEFNARLEELMQQSPLMRWAVKDSMWKHGSASPADMMLELKKYSNENIADQIRCRMLVVDGEADSYGQGLELYDALGRQPDGYLKFTAEDTGLLHCQTAALAVASQRIFEWIECNL